MSDTANFGYLMVHFVEDPASHAEKIFFSLSRGEDPTRWYRLNDGQPVLESRIGTTGVRDPHLPAPAWPGHRRRSSIRPASS